MVQSPGSSDAFDLVPADLPVVTNLAEVELARPWLSELPSLVLQVRDKFGLRLSPPMHGGSCSWVAPAELPDGSPVIVKIGWPHREMYGEPTALRLWAGRGAVRLIDHDAQRHALLLERCEPGDQLATSASPVEERLRAGCAVLRQLWEVRPPVAGDIEDLGAVTGEWADLVDERMARIKPGYDAGLVAEGARLLRDLPRSASRRVLLHGDFNPGNVLSCRGGRWAAIDPKPMIGDPSYDPWPLLEQVDDPFAYIRSGAGAAFAGRPAGGPTVARCAADHHVGGRPAGGDGVAGPLDHGDVAGGAVSCVRFASCAIL